MKFWVGVTDNDWFSFLAQKGADEVNFWQPSGRRPFNAPTGTPFLFKLKRPHNHIAGGGFFVTFTTLPVSLAWEVFGEKNGVASLDDLKDKIGSLRSGPTGDFEIGCTVLTNTFFMDMKKWLSDPPGWSGNIICRQNRLSSTYQHKSVDAVDKDGSAKVLPACPGVCVHLSRP